MIIPVNEQNIMDAAIIHSISWRESHRDFCTPEFIEIHSPERQLRYIRDKMDKGTRFFMLVDEAPVGVVSVTENLIEDLYVLPEKQNMGYGTELLQFAVGQCPDTPSLWILENNVNEGYIAVWASRKPEGSTRLQMNSQRSRWHWNRQIQVCRTETIIADDTYQSFTFFQLS